MEFFVEHQVELFLCIRLTVAFVCGGLIGIQRKRFKGDDIAIYRTHVLLCIGAALAAATSEFLAGNYTIDITRIAAQVVSGISFVGVGVIVKNGCNINGLTTAATLWATGAIGIALGFGAYILGIFGTVLILLLLLTTKDKPTQSKTSA